MLEHPHFLGKYLKQHDLKPFCVISYNLQLLLIKMFPAYSSMRLVNSMFSYNLNLNCKRALVMLKSCRMIIWDESIRYLIVVESIVSFQCLTSPIELTVKVWSPYHSAFAVWCQNTYALKNYLWIELTVCIRKIVVIGYHRIFHS